MGTRKSGPVQSEGDKKSTHSATALNQENGSLLASDSSDEEKSPTIVPMLKHCEVPETPATRDQAHTASERKSTHFKSVFNRKNGTLLSDSDSSEEEISPIAGPTPGRLEIPETPAMPHKSGMFYSYKFRCIFQSIYVIQFRILLLS